MNIKNIAIDWAYSPLIHKQKIVKKQIGVTKLINFEKYEIFFCLPIYLDLKLTDQVYIYKTLSKILNTED